MIVAVDTETTGLDPSQGHQLLEIYVEILEPVYPFKLVGTYYSVVEHDLDEVWELADEYVRKMHTTTDLWRKVDRTAYYYDARPVDVVDLQLRAFLEEHLSQGEGRVTGNSVRLDMNFMDTYLPKSMEWLHYRFLDVSGLSWFLQQNFNTTAYEKDTKRQHSAEFDVEQMIEELKHNNREIVRAVVGSIL